MGGWGWGWTRSDSAWTERGQLFGRRGGPARGDGRGHHWLRVQSARILARVAILLIHGRASGIPAGGPASGPWVPVDQMAALTEWELKPQGACLGERCVPLPHERANEFERGGWFNMAALAAHLGQPVVEDAETGTWCIGEAPADRALSLDSAMAPGFRLPDYRGTEYTLGQFLGRKVFLVSWASW